MHLHLVYSKRFYKLLLVSNSENNRFVANATLQVTYVFNIKNIYNIFLLEKNLDHVKVNPVYN